MGLAGVADDMPVARIEKFFLKTSLRWRKHDRDRPYRKTYPAEMVELSLRWFERKRVAASDFNVRLICGNVNVQEDLENVHR